MTKRKIHYSHPNLKLSCCYGGDKSTVAKEVTCRICLARMGFLPTKFGRNSKPQKETINLAFALSRKAHEQITSIQSGSRSKLVSDLIEKYFSENP